MLRKAAEFPLRVGCAVRLADPSIQRPLLLPSLLSLLDTACGARSFENLLSHIRIRPVAALTR